MSNVVDDQKRSLAHEQSRERFGENAEVAADTWTRRDDLEEVRSLLFR